IVTDFICTASGVGHAIGAARVSNLFAGDADEARYCRESADCLAGQACVQGICVDVQGGSACDFADDCGNGRSCVAAPGGGGACSDGLPNDPCELDGQCASGVCSTGECN